ncbi:hypothetical protein QTP86_008215 [Hemibagrus guttatus]|nr:hypothetical protein QTP86_008215 [Hemibagrus guttatus]
MDGRTRAEEISVSVCIMFVKFCTVFVCVCVIVCVVFVYVFVYVFVMSLCSICLVFVQLFVYVCVVFVQRLYIVLDSLDLSLRMLSALPVSVSHTLLSDLQLSGEMCQLAEASPLMFMHRRADFF